MFKGHCERGHDRIVFDGDPKGWEEHMTREHKAKRIRVGGRCPQGSTLMKAAPGFSGPGANGNGLPKPYPWKAPKPSAGAAKRIAEAAEEGLVTGEDESGTYGRRAGLAEWREARWAA